MMAMFPPDLMLKNGGSTFFSVRQLSHSICYVLSFDPVEQQIYGPKLARNLFAQTGDSHPEINQCDAQS
jgi:hypothetical protein